MSESLSNGRSRKHDRKREHRSSASQQHDSGGSPLQTERGNTTIADSVVSKIAGIAAQEVDGIRMGSGASQTASNLLGSITGGSGGQTTGVSVEVGQEEAAVDLTATVEYGKSVAQLAEAVGATSPTG